MNRFFAIGMLTLVLGAFVAACTANSAQSTLFANDPAIAAAPARVREAYEFAVNHPDALKNVPCYCGCVSMGHRSNYMCYIQDHQLDGAIVFDPHALNCELCIDISQDVMRLTRNKKTATEIRSFIMDKYADSGPSTGTQ